jgi:carbonic anhydrase
VQWLVLSNPIYAEQSEIDAFKTLQGPNFRDIQAEPYPVPSTLPET